MKITKSDIFFTGLIIGVLLMGLINKYRIIDKIKDVYYEHKAQIMIEMLKNYEDEDEDVITIEVDDGTVA